MALISLAIPCSWSSSVKEYGDLQWSYSSRDIRNSASVPGRSSPADKHLRCCIHRIHGISTHPEPNNSTPFMGNSSFQKWGSVIPNLLRTYSFDPASSTCSNTMKNDMNMVESSGTISEGKMKRANCLKKRLMKLRRNWRNIWRQKVVVFENNVGDEDDDVEMRYRSYDRELFSRFLIVVPWSETRLFSKLAFLCNMAYVIPQIKANDLKRYYGLQFLTSSFERKPESAPVIKINPKVDENSTTESSTNEGISLTSSRMTAMAEAGQTAKQDAPEDLQSLYSLPCEWFVCDDPTTRTRFFVIQGIDSLASWQAYLSFEPTEFEETEVLVHKGIYEVAKGIYQQFMPMIVEHLDRHGEQAKLQFTGHSFGGSLALLVHLMLLTRKFVKPWTLQPVVTFGSPFVLCGGEKILEEFGLDDSDHIHSVIMHRDIVPRSFASVYPNHVAAILKHLHGSFESHPTLTTKKILYSPMGKLFIVQPDEKSSPPHPLLPLGSGLYALDYSHSRSSSSLLRAFLNSPHPLETLSDPTAYGSEGSIVRDHDSSNYLKAINTVLRMNVGRVVKVKASKQRNLLWPLLDSPSPNLWNQEDEGKL